MLSRNLDLGSDDSDASQVAVTSSGPSVEQFCTPRKVVASARIARSGSDFAHSSAADHGGKAGPRGARRSVNVPGDVGCRVSNAVFENCGNLGIKVIERWHSDLRQAERHAETKRDLFELRFAEACGAAHRCHPLDSASPLLNESKLMKDAADHPIAKSRHSLANVVNRQTKWEQAGTLDFESIIEERDAHWRSALRIIGVRHCVHDRFAQSDRRQLPSVAPVQRAPSSSGFSSGFRSDFSAASKMTLEKCDSAFDRSNRMLAKLGVIDDVRSVGTRESSDLDPRIGEGA